MLRIEYQLLAAFGLDLIIGDPRWLPHPVRGLGRLAETTERVTRRWLRPARLAGMAAVLLVVGGAALLSWGSLRLANAFGSWLADVVAIYLMYSSIAARDLVRHARRVQQALARYDLPLARRCLALMVGRDTERLPEAEIIRATVESVAEGMVDGVTGALFFGFLAGAVGAITYRAVNTLDSMFGHKTARYLKFGWAAARLDDAANWLPARLTGVLVSPAAWLMGQDGRAAWRIMRRDARRHASPNAGFPESAVAGALAVQLGGRNYYDGQPMDTARLGDALQPLTHRHITLVNRLMLLTVTLFLLLGFVLRATW